AVGSLARFLPAGFCARGKGAEFLGHHFAIEFRCRTEGQSCQLLLEALAFGGVRCERQTVGEPEKGISRQILLSAAGRWMSEETPVVIAAASACHRVGINLLADARAVTRREAAVRGWPLLQGNDGALDYWSEVPPRYAQVVLGLKPKPELRARAE